MDVHAKLAEIRRVVEDARSMPMSASAVVNRAEMLALLDELGGALDAAFSDASRVVADRDSVVDDGRKEAERILEDARSERESIVSDTEVYRVAKREADELLTSAHRESAELRKETDDYVDSKLANFEVVLNKTLRAVEKGRAKISGRHELDALTAAAPLDDLPLPE